MVIKHDESLKSKTTFHVGGTARNFFIPENESELVDLVQSLVQAGETFKVLSGGSNLLINDKKSFDNVIYMKHAITDLVDNHDGRFYVGASNKIQAVVQFVNNRGFGGFEELIGLPALFGGIVYMNAGIGGRNCVLFNISDFIDNVKVLEISSGEIQWIEKNDCRFKYRESIFQNDKYIILGANLVLKKQTQEDSALKISKRREYIRNNQEWGKGCFGTCFSRCSGRILKMISMFKIIRGGVYQSSNSPNWLVNNGTGTYASAMRLINVCKILHRITFQKIECEVRIWE